jgi:hypothetical protein
MVLAGISDAVRDTINFHFPISKLRNLPSKFWDSRISWKNKYKNGIIAKGPKFLGSTTILVTFTDAWHLFKSLNGTFLLIGHALFIYFTYHTSLQLFQIFLYLIIGWVIYRQAFEFSYRFLKKP